MDDSNRLSGAPQLSRTAMYILLAIGPEERHGYAIMSEIARMTDGTVQLGPGGIYTTIRRLLDDGLIEESDERPDPNLDDARRRYYRLTAVGMAVASAEAKRLDALVKAVRAWAIRIP